MAVTFASLLRPDDQGVGIPWDAAKTASCGPRARARDRRKETGRRMTTCHSGHQRLHAAAISSCCRALRSCQACRAPGL